MAFKSKKSNPKQPILGTNMPGSTNSRKVTGAVDKSPVDLTRSVDKLMKGTAEAGAGETAQEDASVNKQSKAQGADMAEIFSKGLRGEDMAGSKPSRSDRVNKGTDMLNGIEESEVSPKYKDWQQIGETNSHVIMAFKKKQVKQF